MNQITQIFFLLSNALLIPVMILLLVSLVRVLFHSGSLLFEFVERHRTRVNREQIETACKTPAFDQFALGRDTPLQQGTLGTAISNLLSTNTDFAHTDYVIRRTQLSWQRRLDALRGLVKLGPSLGLMGTLIPLGPALVGLAVGDIQTMSNNLVIAFSTTVLGLFVGMLAGYLVSIRKHWYAEDAALMDFIAERLLPVTPAPFPSHPSADPATRELEEQLHA